MVRLGDLIGRAYFATVLLRVVDKWVCISGVYASRKLVEFQLQASSKIMKYNEQFCNYC